MDRRTEGGMDRGREGGTDGRTNGRMDEQTDGPINVLMYMHVSVACAYICI